MDSFNEDDRIIHKEILFKSIRYLNNSDYDVRSKGMVQLREESKSSELARSKLRDLIYDNDGCLRMLAAEALSLTQSHPLHAIPVLRTALEVGRSMEITQTVEPWLRICLAHFSTTGTWHYQQKILYGNIFMRSQTRISGFMQFNLCLASPRFLMLRWQFCAFFANTKIRTYEIMPASSVGRHQ